MTRIIIDVDYSNEELQVLLNEIMILSRDAFKKPLVLQQLDVSGQSVQLACDCISHHVWDETQNRFKCTLCDKTV